MSDAHRHERAFGLLRRAGLVLASALALVAAGPAGSADAAVAALERVAASTLTDSSNKSVTAVCPSPKRVVGGAGAIVSGAGQVALSRVRPNEALSGVSVEGLEDQNGHAGFWSVQAIAICATPPAGLERVAATSATSSSNKSVNATCPGGKRLLGTGAELTGGDGQVAINDIIPGSGLQSVSVQALEDGDGTLAPWSVTAIAICANAGPGRERVTNSGPSDSTSPKTVSSPCPVGKQVTGLGGEIVGGGGEVLAQSLVPTPQLDQASHQAREDENGTAANWSVRAFAICANSSQRVVATTPSDSNDKADLVPCPAGKQVTGGGGEVNGGAGQVPLTGVFPAGEDLTEFLAVGEEDENGFGGNWFLRIHAICATSLPGLELVSLTGGDAAQATGLIVTTEPCPTGKRVVGLGAEIGGGGGEVVLKELEPVANLTRVRVTASEDESAFAGFWTLTAHAICANAPPGLELVSAATDPDSDTVGVTATCPAGKNLLGAGGEIEGFVTGGQVVLDDMRPNALLTSVTVTGLEDETGFPNEWFPRAYAICADA